MPRTPSRLGAPVPAVPKFSPRAVVGVTHIVSRLKSGTLQTLTFLTYLCKYVCVCMYIEGHNDRTSFLLRIRWDHPHRMWCMVCGHYRKHPYTRKLLALIILSVLVKSHLKELRRIKDANLAKITKTRKEVYLTDVEGVRASASLPCCCVLEFVLIALVLCLDFWISS